MTKTALLSPPRAGWGDLAAELDAWADRGLTATFWWRDDDATVPTPELGRLTDLSDALRVPLALAVVPATAAPDLARLLEGFPLVSVLQHGWSHANHAAPPAKKCELGADRPAETVVAELAEGKGRLEALFGARALPVLVPPWNRIAPGVEVRLTELGIQGLSTFAPRKVSSGPLACVNTPVCVNTHVDPVAWRDGGRFLGEAESLGMAVAHLRARRLGEVDAGEPTGLLTHHLVMDGETWAFTERFLSETVRHRAAAWLPAGALFGVP
ncbi:polysaccharide deacetylase family protein [Azospirillum sp. sgz302134]